MSTTFVSLTDPSSCRFLINTMRYLYNPSDTISRSEIIYYYNLHIAARGTGHFTGDIHDIFSDHKNLSPKKKKTTGDTLFEMPGLEENLFNRLLPAGFTTHIQYLSRLPLYELSEQLVSIFNFNEKPDAYIQRFQDLVLEYQTRFNGSLQNFLEWWDSSNTVKETSVIIPDDEDAIRIMTVHRSKGLQFPVVIMPFADWSLKPKTNSLLWLQADKSPYKKLGKVGVLSSDNLSDSYFRNDYENEISQSFIDNLNLLYVAFTRAEEKLFVTSPKKKTEKLSSTSTLIRLACNAMGHTGVIIEQGSNDTFTGSRKKKKSSTENLKSYLSNRWQDRLALTSHSSDLLALLEDQSMSKSNYGIILHRVLSEITEIEEAETVIDRLVFEGLITEDDRQKIQGEINSILSDPQIGKYFGNNYKVKSERDLLLPGGEVFRPDRVLMKDDETIVIDFKTGAAAEKHISQLKNYQELLQRMKYPNVKAKLIYLAERKVKDVE